MKKITTTIFLSCLVMLAACTATRPELKAPCDPLQCKDRINVNTWYKG